MRPPASGLARLAIQPPPDAFERRNPHPPQTTHPSTTITRNPQESRVDHRAFLFEVLSHAKEGPYTLYAVPVAPLEISRSEN